MRICLLGEYFGNLDEGMRNVSFHFAEELSKEYQILTLDLRDVFTKTFWNGLKKFNPQVIHYINGFSINSFMLLKMVLFYSGDSKTVMSAMHPGFSFLFKWSIPLCKPDKVLVQSIETEEKFKKYGCETAFLPCGVDVQKFIPVTTEFRDGLRDKYGIDKDKFVILHVGSLKKGRNVKLMEKLQKENNQVIIVGAVSTGIEKKLTKQLKKSGCLVWTRHFRDIEDIYALSDCYIFPIPVENRINSIEMPLSVLEAMSCNLPVLATRFGALPRVFEAVNGLFFCKTEKEFFTALEEVKRGISVKTRENVLQYSWVHVVRGLEDIYEELISDEDDTV